MSSSFWEFVWLILWTFFLLTYLMVLLQIVVDVFRDRRLSGFSKAIWIIGLIFIPLFTALVYLIFRGGGMGRRRVAEENAIRAENEEYLREVTRVSPADQIARASALLKEGTINESEFAALKAKALS